MPQGEKNGSMVIMRQTMVPGYAVLSLLWGRSKEIQCSESLLLLILSETILPILTKWKQPPAFGEEELRYWTVWITHFDVTIFHCREGVNSRPNP